MCLHSFEGVLITILPVKVISPQRIPATVAPTLLLSPSVFIHSKSSGRLSAVVQDSSPAPSALSRPPLQEEIRVLSKSQLQATLLQLIQVKLILQIQKHVDKTQQAVRGGSYCDK